MSLASAVRIAVSSVRSSAGRAGQPCGGARKSATTSIASVAEPPLPERQQLAAGVEARPQRGRGGRQRLAVVGQRLRAQLADLGRLHQDRLADVAQHRVEVGLAARPGTGRGSSRRRCRAPAAPAAPPAGRGGRRTRARAPTARGRASRRAPGGRTGRRPAATNSHSAPAPGPKPIVRQPRSAARRSAARASARRPRRRTRSRCRRARRQIELPVERAALGGQADRRQRALADDHRMDELDRDVAHVRARRRATRRARSGARRGRSARPSRGRAARCRAASTPKNASPARRRRSSAASGSGLPVTRGVRVPARRAARGRSISQSRNASSPSPVRALMTIRSHAGMDRVEVVE